MCTPLIFSWLRLVYGFSWREKRSKKKNANESSLNEGEQQPLIEEEDNNDDGDDDEFIERLSNLSLSQQSIFPSLLKLPFPLFSAAGYPKYTNYVGGFKDLLDYIFVSENDFSVVGVAPFPSESVLSEETALPSSCFPSDHLAVVVDLNWGTRE